MNDANLKVLTNIIGAVETGGQKYGNRNYDAYAAPYTNSPKEVTITLGWPQFYGGEAYKLVSLIYAKDPATFDKLDPRGSIKAMINGEHDWVAEKWKPSTYQRYILLALIDSESGHAAQDELFAEQMKKYISDCEKTYTGDIRAEMMYCEIRHLGGKGPVDRVFTRCRGDYSLGNIMTVLKLDRSDKSSDNQVGDKRYWSRHEKCREFIERYAVTEAPNAGFPKNGGGNMAYNVDTVIAVAKAEIGYLEKRSNAQLDSETANAGSGNYTKYWRDIEPSYQGQSWCDAFVSWCFMKAYGSAAADRLLCGGLKSYYTPTSASYYKKAGRWSTSPSKGDQIFFKNSQRICHTGIVTNVSGGKVYTVEGNTSGGSAVIANGGGVCAKSYDIGNSRIAGYGHPDYAAGSASGNSSGKSASSAASAKTSAALGGKYMFAVEQVQYGSNNNSVLLAQEILKARGLYIGELDRSFGSGTEAAVVKYQKSRKLDADGIIGKKTWADMLGL